MSQFLLVGTLVAVFLVKRLSGEQCLLWEDQFESDVINTDNWDFELGDGCNYGPGMCGWGNYELQRYTNNSLNAWISNGTLKLSAREDEVKDGVQRYTSARIRTKHLKDWHYGKVEVRVKCPKGQGVWPSIWMLPTNNTFGQWPRSGEIDIFELQGHRPSTIFMTAHFGEAWNNKSHRGGSYSLPSGDFSQDFHTFSIEWKKDSIDWFVDGTKHFTLNASETEPFIYPFNEDFHLLMNIAVGGNFAGNPDNTTVFPQIMYVEYVKVYQNC